MLLEVNLKLTTRKDDTQQGWQPDDPNCLLVQVADSQALGKVAMHSAGWLACTSTWHMVHTPGCRHTIKDIKTIKLIS